MEDNFANRLKVFIETEGLTNSQFADLCEIPRPSLSQIISGRNKKISDILIGAIHQTFPKLNILWLMFGEGEMYAPGTSSNGADDSGFANSDGSSLPTSGYGDRNNAEMRNENTANPSDGPFPPSEAKENGLTAPRNTPPSRMNTGIEADFKIMNLQRQIDEMRQNPRRVTQITIYYDDSTFETFIPGIPKK
ncbi:MAG: helix-turn-helix domain-containing protein [Muribaculaceae bacterium]|nr:helix-turn-helix domain-containing protein [Muribaculaceae bacterium]